MPGAWLSVPAAVLLTALLAFGQVTRSPRRMPLEVVRQMAQPAGAGPVEVLNAEKGWGGTDALMPLARSENNTRLDYDYTVFAIVEDMSVVEKIQEGDVIRSIDVVKCRG